MTLHVAASEKGALLDPCGVRAHPTTGTVHVLGHRLCRVDMFTLRRHIGNVDPRSRTAPDLTARQAVRTGPVAADLPRRFDPAPA